MRLFSQFFFFGKYLETVGESQHGLTPSACYYGRRSAVRLRHRAALMICAAVFFVVIPGRAVARARNP
jgi:hypothetical protein